MLYQCFSALLLSLLVVSAATPQKRIDLFGDPLPDGALVRLGTVRFRHGDSIRTVAYSPDGKILASAGDDHVIRLWHPETGKPLKQLVGHRDDVTSLVFSPDGKRLASAGNGYRITPRPSDATVRIWDVESGRQLHLFKSPNADDRHGFAAVAFSPDGKFVAAGAENGFIWLWESDSGKELKKWQGHEYGITGLQFLPNGVLASADAGPYDPKRRGKKDGQLHLWEIPTGKLLYSIDSPEKAGGFCSLSVSPDGKKLAFVVMRSYFQQPRTHSVRVWDVADRKELKILPLRAAYQVLFSSDGKMLAVGCDRRCVLWDVPTWARLRQFSGRWSNSPWAFAPDSRTLATAPECTVQLRDTALGKEIRPADGHQARINAVAFSPNGKSVLSGGWDGTARLWDAESGKLLREWDAGGSVSGVAFAPDGNSIAFCEYGGPVYVTGVQPADRPKLLDERSGVGLDSISFSPDGKHLASGSAIWDVAMGEQVHRSDDRYEKVVFTADGQAVARADHNGYISVIDAKTGHKLPQFEKFKPDGPYVAFSPNGKWVASGTWTGAIRVFDLKTGNGEFVIRISLPFVSSGDLWKIACSNDGKMVSGAKMNGDILVWDSATGKVLARLRGHLSYANALTFSPDGRKLATGGLDSTILIWDLDKARGQTP